MSSFSRNDTLDVFKQKTSWESAQKAGGIDGRANYSGPSYSEFLIGPSMSRDADLIEQSNFATALEMLGGESLDVEVVRFGHWGCGWSERILVRADNDEKAQILFDIYKCLEEYALLDDSDYSEREQEYLDETHDQYAEYFSSALEKWLGRDLSHAKPEHVKECTRELYSLDASYRGSEDAFVCADKITDRLKWNECHFRTMSKRGNHVAHMILRKIGGYKR